MDNVRSLYRSLVALAGVALFGASTAACTMGADLPDDEAVDEAAQAVVSLAPIEVGLVTIPPNGPPQRERVAFTTQRNYAAPPLVFATAQGGPFPDTFSISTTGVGTNGFSANMFRTDAVAGWAEPLKFGWMVLPSFNSQNTQTGRTFVGTQPSGQLRTVSVTFPHAFAFPPTIILTPRGGDYQDSFTASIRSVSNTGFVANVYRVDAPGWGQPLELDWAAWDMATDFAPYGADSGITNVATSNSKVKTIWVSFNKTFSQPPAILATARGQDYQDTFAVTATMVSHTGFQANVARVDYNGGWGQALQLDWLAIPPGGCPTGEELTSSGTCVPAAPAPQPPAGGGNTLYSRWMPSGGSAAMAPGNKTFIVQVIGSGTTPIPVTFDLTASNIDTYLYLLDENGNVLDSNDDVAAGNTNSRIQKNLAPGSYRVVAATKNLWQWGEFSISSDKAFLRYPQRLEIQRADQLQWAYDDVGTGADGSVSVWRPNLAAYPGYSSLGDVAVPFYGSPRGTYVVKGEGDVLARPIDYNWVWADWDSGGNHDASVWDPIPPSGYTCLGTVVALGYDKPSSDLVRCVKTDYVLPANPAFVWDDRGSGASHDVSFFEATLVDHRSLPTGTFGALPYYGNANGRAYFMLNKSAIGNPEFWGTPLDLGAAQRYAPRIWLHGAETFFPSSTGFFEQNTHEVALLTNGTTQTYKVTNEALACPSCTNPAFLTGQAPNTNSVPTYAEIVTRTGTNITDVVYWQFYPHNQGKTLCSDWYAKGGCKGQFKSFGNRVGDWEHLTVRFIDRRPWQVFAHGAEGGVTQLYGDKYASYVDLRPEAYAALGSHGLYIDEGAHVWRSFSNGDKFTDVTQRGMAWDTWNNVVSFQVPAVGPYTDAWLNYLGRWGNAADGCIPLPYADNAVYCELDAGPQAILRDPISYDLNTALQ